MDFLSSFAGALKFGVLNMAWIFIVLWGVERLWGRPPSVQSQLRSLVFWMIYAATGAVIVTAFAYAKKQVGIAPLIRIPLFGTFGFILAPIVWAALYDLFNYWMHRAQHKWFWAQHSIHHSIEELSGVNSYFHWTEDLIRLVFITAPIALLFGTDSGKASLVVAMLLMAWGNYIHSPIPFHFGKWGRYIMADNRWHRIHHSVKHQHFDKNFATAFPVWDVLFGTACFPKGNEWPRTGVHDLPEARTVREYLFRPFGYERGNAAVGTVKAAE